MATGAERRPDDRRRKGECLRGAGRFTSSPDDGNVSRVPSIRDIRLATGHSQRTFAVLLDVPFETYRPFDSGRRPVPTAIIERAERILDLHRRATELFALDALASEFDIHPRTLRAAARDGRLRVQFSTRSAFGRPIRVASRKDVDDSVRKAWPSFPGADQDAVWT